MENPPARRQRTSPLSSMKSIVPSLRPLYAFVAFRVGNRAAAEDITAYDREQQELIDMIERLLAGDTVAVAGVREQELEKLLAIAAKLNERKPEPSAEFEERLEARMTGFKTATAAASGDIAGASSGDGVAAADAAQYLAKNRGRNRVESWKQMNIT